MLAGWLPKVVHISVSDANGAAQQALMDCGPVCWYSVGLPGPYAQGGGMACEEGNSKVWGGTESNLGRGQGVTYEGAQPGETATVGKEGAHASGAKKLQRTTSIALQEYGEKQEESDERNSTTGERGG